MYNSNTHPPTPNRGEFLFNPLMSEKKIGDYLQKSRPSTVGNKLLTPVVLSDSKGGYLKNQAYHPEDKQIVMWNKSGANIKKVPTLAGEKHQAQNKRTRKYTYTSGSEHAT